MLQQYTDATLNRDVFCLNTNIYNNYNKISRYYDIHVVIVILYE